MGVFDRAAAFVEARLARFFRHAGFFVADRPWTCITLCLVLAAALSSGVMQIETESSPRRLYAPEGNRGQKDLDLVDDVFNSIPTTTNVLIAYSEDGRNLFTVEALNGLFQLVQDLKGLSIEDNGSTLRLQDLCSKSGQKGYEDECSFMGIVDLMDGPIERDSEKPVLKPDFVIDKQGSVAITSLFAGGRTLSADNSMVEEVRAWKLNFDLVFDDRSELKSEALSRAMLQHLDKVAKEQSSESPYLVVYEAYFSEGEELDKSTSGDVGLLMITFIMVITFSFLAVRSYSDFVTSKGNVVWGAQLGVMLAIGSAFGLMGYCGVKFNPVVSTTAFLLLGLGVDDAYVLIQAYHSSADRLGPEATVRDRMGATFETAGVSIFFTSVTDILAFAVGASSAFPAVVGFCAYTATGVAFDFLFQVVLFGAVLAIDAHREYCGVKEWRVLCGDGWLRNDKYSSGRSLIKDGKGPADGRIPVMPEVAAVSRAMKAYGEILLNPICSGVVLLLFAGYGAYAIIGTMKVGTGLDIRDLAPSDSYWTKFVNQNFEYFTEKGPPYTLAFPHGSIDWSSKAERGKAMELLEELEGLECMRVEPRGVWLRELYDNSTVDVAELEGDDFLLAVSDFLSGRGFSFREDVLLDVDDAEDMNSRRVGNVVASRMIVRMEPLSTTSGDKEGVPCMQGNRRVLDAWVDNSGFDGRDPPAISFHVFAFWDGSSVIVEQTARNLIYAGVCCGIMTLLILPHPLLCLMAMLVVASILAGVVASMALLLDIRIETISMIDLVLAIGFSIDNVAHYCHAYMISRAPTRRDKAVAALQLIGIPILLGDASTMVALLPLLGSKSRIFQSFFLILFAVLLLGALHAVVLLPVVLGLIGPLPQYSHDAHSGESVGGQLAMGNAASRSSGSEDNAAAQSKMEKGHADAEAAGGAPQSEPPGAPGQPDDDTAPAVILSEPVTAVY